MPTDNQSLSYRFFISGQIILSVCDENDPRANNLKPMALIIISLSATDCCICSSLDLLPLMQLPVTIFIALERVSHALAGAAICVTIPMLKRF